MIDIYHQHLPVDAIRHLRGERLSWGQFDHLDPAIAPVTPPTEAVATLRRACRDDGLTLYGVLSWVEGWREVAWWIGAMGRFNAIPTINADWNRDRIAIVPMAPFVLMDGTPMLNRDICHHDLVAEASVKAWLSSCGPYGRRSAHEAIVDIAQAQERGIRAERAANRDEFRQMARSLPWQTVEALRVNRGDPSRTREDRIMAEMHAEATDIELEQRAVEPAQELARQANRAAARVG